jgi:Peptidase family S58
MKRRTFTNSILALSAAPLLAHQASTSPAAAAEPSGPPLMGGSIVDVPGIKIGHHTLTRRPTGCTVILCEDGAVGGVDVRGSAPAPVRPTCSTRPTRSSRSRPSCCRAAVPTGWRLPRA